MYKNLRNTYSKRRFSKIQRIGIFPNKYAIRDYKTKKLHAIETISRGRWKFYGKQFNKLADINWRHVVI
jgi:hypothetical protein